MLVRDSKGRRGSSFANYFYDHSYEHTIINSRLSLLLHSITLAYGEVMKKAVPNLLNRTEQYRDDHILYHFGNGLSIKTESMMKRDSLRILPLGNVQGSLMNSMQSQAMNLIRHMQRVHFL